MTDEQTIDKAKRIIGTVQYEIGKILYNIKKEKRYYKYASHIKSWRDYIKEIGLTFNQAQNYIDVYETFNSFPDETGELFERMNDISRFHKLGLIKEKDIPEIYEKCKTLTIKDWKDELHMLEGYSSYLGCTHDKYETYIKCKRCGKWLKQD